MADEKSQIRCPNPNILATLVIEMPKECIKSQILPLKMALKAAHWISDQYRAVSPETKQLVAESAFRAVGGPFASICLSILKK